MKQEILPPLPAVIDAEADPAIDAEDLPEELAFTPVEQRSKRWTGITAQKQRLFIAHLAATGAVSMAAKIAGHSTSAFYQLRKRDDAGSFAAAWDRAVEAGARRVADLLMEYAIYGVPETLSKEGRVILERSRPNVRAMQHIAASRFPESFGAGINPVDGPAPSAPPISAGFRTTPSSAPRGTCSPAPAPTGPRCEKPTPISTRRSTNGTCTTPT